MEMVFTKVLANVILYRLYFNKWGGGVTTSLERSLRGGIAVDSPLGEHAIIYRGLKLWGYTYTVKS